MPAFVCSWHVPKYRTQTVRIITAVSDYNLRPVILTQAPLSPAEIRTRLFPVA